MTTTIPDIDLQSPGDRLEETIAALPPTGVTLAEVRDRIGKDGMMMLAAFLTVVFLVPVSIPGVSTVFGAGILLIGISRLFRRELWLPRRVGKRVIATERLRGALQRGLKWVRRLERLSKPHRMAWATRSNVARFINDFGLVLGAVLLMAPFGLIPFSNTLPALALLLLAIGSLQRDGACIIAGHVAILATIGYFALLLGGGGYVVVQAFRRLF